MRISDWSSDVCSSDLSLFTRSTAFSPAAEIVVGGAAEAAGSLAWPPAGAPEGDKGAGEAVTDGAWATPSAGAAAAGLFCFCASRAATSALIVSSGSPLLARSEEHTPELQSLMRISYAVFCLKKKTT